VLFGAGCERFGSMLNNASFRICLRVALPFVAIRRDDIEGMIANLEDLRSRLRTIAEARFNYVIDRANLINGAIERGEYPKARALLGGAKPFKGFFALPFLGEPDFRGVRTRILEAAAALQQSQGLLFTDEQPAASAQVKRIILIVQRAKATSAFMARFSKLRNEVYLGRIKGYRDAAGKVLDARIFNKVYLEWARDSQVTRAGPGPRYWYARSYKTAFISEKSNALAFNACDDILYAIDIDNFRHLIPHLRLHKRNQILGVILDYIKRKPPVNRAREIPPAQRDDFLKKMIAAVEDQNFVGDAIVREKVVVRAKQIHS